MPNSKIILGSLAAVVLLAVAGGLLLAMFLWPAGQGIVAPEATPDSPPEDPEQDSPPPEPEATEAPPPPSAADTRIHREIQGIVVDRQGEPIPGAHVEATPDVGEGRHDTMSREDGTFHITGLPPGLLEVRAHHPDHLPSASVPAREGERELRLVMGAAGALTGQVRGFAGEPIEGVAVFAQPAGDQPDDREPMTIHDEARLTRTSADGQYRVAGLAPGTYTVCVQWTGGARVDCLPVEILADDTVRCDFARQGRLTIRIPGLAPTAEGERTVEVTSRNGDLLPVSAVLDPAGAIVLPALPPGDYTLRWPGGFPVPIQIGNRPRDQELTLELERGEISGQVVRTDGGSPAEARVRAARRAVEEREARSAQVTADAYGNFHFEALPPGSYDLFADLPDQARGSSEEIPLQRDQIHRDIVIEARRGGDLEVWVRDSGGAPAHDAQVWCEDNLGFLFEVPATEEGGLHRLTEMGAGRYRLLVGLAGHALHWQGIDITAGDTLVQDLYMSTGGTPLHISVTRDGDPAHNAIVKILTAQGQAVPDVATAFVANLQGNHTDARGLLLTCPYPPGTYQIRVLHGDQDPREETLTLVGDTTPARIRF